MKTNGILESYQEFTQIGHFNCFTSVADPGQIHLKQILHTKISINKGISNLLAMIHLELMNVKMFFKAS